MGAEETITVVVNDEEVEIPKSGYIKAKTVELREFGYPLLTEEFVAEELEKVLYVR